VHWHQERESSLVIDCSDRQWRDRFIGTYDNPVALERVERLHKVVAVHSYTDTSTLTGIADTPDR
jgi:hypothetical protein